MKEGIFLVLIILVFLKTAKRERRCNPQRHRIHKSVGSVLFASLKASLVDSERGRCVSRVEGWGMKMHEGIFLVLLILLFLETAKRERR
jgi:hypothetical protein